MLGCELLFIIASSILQSDANRPTRPSSSRPNSSSIPRALNALTDTSEEEDEESSPVQLAQQKNMNMTSGDSPPPSNSTSLDQNGGVSSSGASGLGAPTAPLKLNKNSKKGGENDANGGKL